MAQIEGVDVSHHNGTIDWVKAREDGISFAFIKATEGGTRVDPKAMSNLARCREAGIAPGMYHFYRHDVDPVVQAAHFLQNMGPHEEGDLPPAIDVEAPGDGSGPLTYPKTEAVHRIGEVVRAVRAAIGRPPLIYTYPSAWVEVTNNSNAFADKYPLWIASYGVNTPKLVGGWTSYAVWQYTDQGTVKGIGSGTDRDRFNGDAADLDAFRLGTLTKGGNAVLNQDGNVRADPGLSAAVLAQLVRGTPVMITDGPVPANGRNWWKIDDGADNAGWCSSRVLTPA